MSQHINIPRIFAEQLSLFRAFPIKTTSKIEPDQKLESKNNNIYSDLPLYQGCLTKLWQQLNDYYFPSISLDCYQISWSKRRQLRTLASCNISKKRVNVAQELNYSEHYNWLSPLLYHEMCHAALGTSIKKVGKKTPWHGRDFKLLESRHPLMADFDRWVKTGGWATAVRSHRTKQAHLRRKNIPLLDEISVTLHEQEGVYVRRSRTKDKYTALKI